MCITFIRSFSKQLKILGMCEINEEIKCILNVENNNGFNVT